MWAPLTALQSSKPNSTSHHTPQSISTGASAITAVILRGKSGEDCALSLCTLSSIYSQKKKSIVVISGLCMGQLMGHLLPIHRPENHASIAVSVVAPKWAGAPSCWGRQLQLHILVPPLMHELFLLGVHERYRAEGNGWVPFRFVPKDYCGRPCRVCVLPVVGRGEAQFCFDVCRVVHGDTLKFIKL
jgi:hypothetical protein